MERKLLAKVQLAQSNRMDFIQRNVKKLLPLADGSIKVNNRRKHGGESFIKLLFEATNSLSQ